MIVPARAYIALLCVAEHVRADALEVRQAGEDHRPLQLLPQQS